jgi:hypothetical protein
VWFVRRPSGPIWVLCWLIRPSAQGAFGKGFQRGFCYRELTVCVALSVCERLLMSITLLSFGFALLRYAC